MDTSTTSAKKDKPKKIGTPKPLRGTRLFDLGRKLGGGWLVDDEHHLEKSFEFETYLAGIHFVNQLAELAEKESHHPVLHVGYKEVKVLIWTHRIDGLTEADFSLAAKVDALFASREAS